MVPKERPPGVERIEFKRALRERIAAKRRAERARREEMRRLYEEERATNKRLVEVLFGEGREVIREEDIPFHGWSSTDIVNLLLEDVISEVVAAL